MNSTDHIQHDSVDMRTLSRRLRVPQSYLRAEMRAGRIPYRRSGGRTRFSPPAVAHALRQRPTRETHQ